jgi:Mrp family chromosome partitioning ATPase
MTLIRHKILVLSGKGGVGKSTVSSQLALAFMSAGLNVGLLDVDLCGPSIPTILGVVGQSMVSGSQGWIPVYSNSTVSDKRLAIMSIGFLLEDRNAPVIWRGPKKTSLIRQFLEDVAWGPLDVLVIDTPPGTSDENITVCEQLTKYQPDGAVIVTTPQNVSLDDVRKEITFCKQVGIPVLGIVENMSGFVCPCCGEAYNIFSKGGGEALAQELNVPFIGRIPLDPSVSQACDQGTSFIDAFKNSKSLEALHNFSKKFIEDDRKESASN